MSSVISKIIERQQQREQARKTDWWGLVWSIGDGAEPDADHVERVLTDTGKSTVDLENAVMRYQRRKGLVGQVLTGAQARQDQTDIGAALEQKGRDLEDLLKRHQATVEPLLARRAANQQLIQDADAARGQLRDSCPYEEGEEIVRSAQFQLKGVEARLRELRDMLSTAEGNARTLEARAEKGDHHAPAYRQEAEAAKRRAEGYRAELAAASARRDQLVRESEGSAEFFLTP